MPPYLEASVWVKTLPRAAGSITGSSNPLTVDEIASMAQQYSSEFDAAAAHAGYAVPIATTSAAAYGQMQLYVGWGLGWDVLRTLFPGGKGASDMPRATEYFDAYMAAKKMLADGTLVLIGAPTDTGEGGRELPRSFQTSESGDAVAAYASPTIELNSVF